MKDNQEINTFPSRLGEIIILSRNGRLSYYLPKGMNGKKLQKFMRDHQQVLDRLKLKTKKDEKRKS